MPKSPIILRSKLAGRRSANRHTTGSEACRESTLLTDIQQSILQGKRLCLSLPKLRGTSMLNDWSSPLFAVKTEGRTLNAHSKLRLTDQPWNLTFPQIGSRRGLSGSTTASLTRSAAATSWSTEHSWNSFGETRPWPGGSPPDPTQRLLWET